MFVGDKTEEIKLAKGIAVVCAGVSTIGIGAFGISKLVKSSGDEKKYEPSPEINPESDKPTDSREEEKDTEKKEEKKSIEKL
jgi:uncharacterized protein YsxB (DUF464 family)